LSYTPKLKRFLIIFSALITTNLKNGKKPILLLFCTTPGNPPTLAAIAFLLKSPVCYTQPGASIILPIKPKLLQQHQHQQYDHLHESRNGDLLPSQSG